MSVIDEYLDGVTPPQKRELERIREIVKRVVPQAEETISYGMPAFRYQQKPLVYFAAFKDHLSLFPTSGPTDALKDKLKDFKISKGTIRFTTDKPLPESIIEEILLYRLADISKNQK